MNKSFKLVLLCLLVYNYTFCQCPSGGVIFLSQAEIDQFAIDYPNCEEISGNVAFFETDISDLTPLSKLKRINGNLFIAFNVNLSSLEGLHNLSSINGRLTINQIDGITSLIGLRSLVEVDALVINFNANLQDLNGLENLQHGGGTIIIEKNPMLVNLDALSNLQLFGDIQIVGNSNLTHLPLLYKFDPTSQTATNLITDNTNLTSIKGLDSIKIAGRFDIVGNPRLKSLDGFNINHLDKVWLDISDNDSLINVEALQSLDSVTGNIHAHLFIRNNDQLENLNGLENLQLVKGDLVIESNASLNDISALINFKYSEGNIIIESNPELGSLDGLDSLAINNLESIRIQNNGSLTDCAVRSICKAISEGKDLTIDMNETGCNNVPEVESLCIISTDDIKEDLSVLIYPNPTNSILNIHSTSSSKILRVLVLNVLGQQLKSFEAPSLMNIADLSAGHYILQIETNISTFNYKVLKI